MLHKPLSPSLNYTSRVRGSDGSGDIGGGVIVGVALISRLVILLVRRVVLGHRVWADLPFFLKTWASTKSYASASYLTDRSAAREAVEPYARDLYPNAQLSLLARRILHEREVGEVDRHRCSLRRALHQLPAPPVGPARRSRSSITAPVCQ